MIAIQNFKTSGGGALKKLANIDRVAVSLALFLATFVLSFIAYSLIIQPQGIEAVAGLGLVGSPILSFGADSGLVNFDITPTQSGVLVSALQSLTTTTNVPTGFNLSLSTPNTPTLATTSGTITSPVALANNTWGYALTHTGAAGVANDFDSSYATPAPSANSKWANPSANAVIKNTSTVAANDKTDIYYGAKIDTTLPSSTYSNNIRYTAVANIANIPAPTIASITPNSGTTAGGTTITIVGTGFTANNQSVTTGITIDGQACINPSISSNTPTIIQDTITCTTPVHPSAAAVNVAVTTWQGTATSVNSYTYITPTLLINNPVNNQIFPAGTTSIALNVTTNIAATCYYSIYQGPDIAMATTGGTTHHQTIIGLTDNNTYANYVRCQAAAGHSYSQLASILFHVRAATPATPTLTPAMGATVNTGTNYIYVTSPGATCYWGTTSYPATSYQSGQPYTTIIGTNTLYYSCTASSGNTISTIRSGSWHFTGVAPKTYMQNITTANCPTVRTRVNDYRDDATYWVQKLADGKCWMLTNLAYGGGGDNAYGDTKNITNGEAYSAANNIPYFYIPPGSNKTTGNTDPSSSTGGTGQYGYLYNWCAAMGAQVYAGITCAFISYAEPNTGISICPAGWRLPTGNGGEFHLLTNAIGANNNSAGSTILRSAWLGMYSGEWLPDGSGFHNQGIWGNYWSSWHRSTYASWRLQFSDSRVNAYIDLPPEYGIAVRCIAI